MQRRKGKTRSNAKKVHAKSRAQRSSPANHDLIKLILQDHKPLKQLITVMKNANRPIADRRAAFEEFAPMLLIHSKSEEKLLYVFMKAFENLRQEGIEGEVAHGLADQMAEEAKRANNDRDVLGAKLKILAEVVERHIQDEEKMFLPDFKRSSELNTRIEMGEQYLQLKRDIEYSGADDAPPERFVQEANVPMHH